jgi:hypothetical protein
LPWWCSFLRFTPRSSPPVLLPVARRLECADQPTLEIYLFAGAGLAPAEEEVANRADQREEQTRIGLSPIVLREPLTEIVGSAHVQHAAQIVEEIDPRKPGDRQVVCDPKGDRPSKRNVDMIHEWLPRLLVVVGPAEPASKRTGIPEMFAISLDVYAQSRYLFV